MYGSPLVVSYGAGVDSTALLVGLHQRGQRPDLILFADVGSEWPETYEYLDVIRGWLAKVGFPDLEVVRYRPRHGRYTTLEGNCLVNRTLPSLAFGRKSCSLKWKVAPMDRRVASWPPAIDAWDAGLKVTRAIGYDAGPKDSKRAWHLRGDSRYEYVYPLREWGWDRERCEAEIAAAGLPLPQKSACFFCPATQPHELIDLHRKHPELTERIIRMEATAKPNLAKVEGLWRRATRKRPGSMTALIESLRDGVAAPGGIRARVAEMAPPGIPGCSGVRLLEHDPQDHDRDPTSLRACVR